jgi:SAM-dependent methyltransferase
MQQSERWWEQFYSDIYAEIMFKLDHHYLEQARGFIFHHLQLKPGDLIFDQCCGIGNISLLLGQADMRVRGIDQSENYVQIAKARAKERALDCQFSTADAFTYTTEMPCDAAINWHTSFGYTPNDAQNRKMLESVYASLKPGGLFLLDFLNLPYVFKHFQATMITYHQSTEGDVEVIRESSPDLNTGMLNQSWAFVYRQIERRIQVETATRMYLPHQLGALIQQSGFDVLDYFGGLNGLPLNLETPRCIVLARRPF